MPVFEHLEGVNHVYVDGSARLDMAKSIVLKDVPDVEHVNLQITQLLFGPQHGSQNPPAPRS